MLKLYGAKSTGSAAPQAALEHVGASYEMRHIDLHSDEHRAADFLAINPRGQVPTLVLEDGSIVTESAAIMMHIADLHPDAGLMPSLGSAARAQAYRWMVFAATNLYEGVLRYEYPHYYSTGKDTAGVMASAEATLGNAWRIVNDALRGETAIAHGEAKAVDIYLAMLVSWHHDRAKLKRSNPNLQAAFERTLQLSGVAKVFAEHELI